MDDVASAGQLLDAVGAVRRALRRVTGRPGLDTELTTAQAELVRLVRREPGLPVAAAADRLGVAANTVSTLVRQLADAGVLLREPDPADRRVARLAVAPEARRRIEGWRDRRAEVTGRALARLDEADREALRTAAPALTRLAAALQEAS